MRDGHTLEKFRTRVGGWQQLDITIKPRPLY